MSRRTEVVRPPEKFEFQGVQNRPNYQRDPYSKAIFVVDEKALQEHKEKKLERSKINNANEKIAHLEENVKELRNDIKDMKEAVSSLINILSKNPD